MTSPGTPPGAALEASHIGLTYPGPPDVVALHDINLRVDYGEFVAVVGPSGAGKSSLLHVFGLLVTPTTGTIRLNRIEIHDAADNQLTYQRGHGIGFVFQAFHLLERRTVLENVALPLRYQGVGAREATQRALDALHEVDLAHRATARAQTLSGGERQRTAIARALVTNPAVLLCDEPTGNLDSTNSDNVIDLLWKLHRQGRTIVIITHDETIAARIPRTVRLFDGKIIESRDNTAAAAFVPVSRDQAQPGQAQPPPPAAGLSGSASGSSGRLRFLDLIDETVAVLLERGWRTVLTCLGTVLGVATLIAILGLTSTATTQISKQFDQLAATTVSAQSFLPRAYAPAQLQRAARLNGVQGVASIQPVDAASVDAGPTSPEAVAASSLPVVAVTPASWPVIAPSLSWGRTFDDAIASQRVAVLGAAAARQAGVYGPLGTQSILIGGHPYVVIGVFNDVQRRADLLLSVIIPTAAATADFGPLLPNQNTQIVVSTAIGAAPQIAGELPYAIAPEDPGSLDVIPPPDPRQLRDHVTVDLTSLFVTLALVTLFVGMVGIANTSLIAVIERTSEIGLRRALGARRRAVSTQFLTESTLIGAAGGLIGALFGLVFVLAVALAREWTPVLPRLVIACAPLGGALAGAVAGYLPARRAGKVDPAEALRS